MTDERGLREDRLTERLARIEARLEIGQLPIRYALAVDGRDVDTWVSLFVADVDVGRHGRGRDALRKVIEPKLRWFYRSVHQICGHRIELTGADTARGAAYCRAEHEVGDRWIVMAICYFDDYRRVDGEWLFARRAERHWYAADVNEHPQAVEFDSWGTSPSPPQLPHHFETWTPFWDSNPERSAPTHAPEGGPNVETSNADTRPVVEFDHHSPEYARDFIDQYSQLHARCPMGWSDQYGGFWVTTRYDDVAFVAHDDETFSSRHDLPNDGKSYTGITLPSPPNRSTPIEMDPPQFPKYRRILNPPFAPAAIERLKPRMRDFTTWCLDRCIETGKIDFVLDLANPVPAMATLAFLGLPVEEWDRIATPYHDVVAHPPGSEEWNDAVAALVENLGRCEEAIAERRREPRDDFITRLVQAEIDGAPIPDDEIVEMCNLVLGGGVDTTTGLIGHALNYLDEHPEIRPRLHEDPAFMASAVEEWLRYYSPTQALARTATRDVEVGGQLVKEGERVLVCWAAANHDPSAFDRHDEIVLDRFPNRHAAFGLGAHRCLGSNFTRVEITVVLEEVLRRMPDYKLVPGGAVHYQDIGTVNGWARMPATFIPGTRVGDRTLPGA